MADPLEVMAQAMKESVESTNALMREHIINIDKSLGNLPEINKTLTKIDKNLDDVILKYGEFSFYMKFAVGSLVAIAIGIGLNVLAILMA